MQFMKYVSLFLISLGLAFPAFAQRDSTRWVSGTVIVDGSQTKLSDVVVLIKGTSLGTYSDAKGQYRVKLSPDEQQLVFSAIGYLPQEVSVNAQQVIDVSLKPEPQTLAELKVTGYIVPQYSRRLRKAIRKRQRQPTTYSPIDSASTDK